MSHVPPVTGHRPTTAHSHDIPSISQAAPINYTSTVCSLDNEPSCYARIVAFFTAIPNWIASFFRAAPVSDQPHKLADASKLMRNLFVTSIVSKLKSDQCKMALILECDGRTSVHTADIQGRDPQAIKALQLKGEETLKAQINTTTDILTARLIIAEKDQRGITTFYRMAKMGEQSIEQQDEGEGKTPRECAGWLLAHLTRIPEAPKKEICLFFRSLIVT